MRKSWILSINNTASGIDANAEPSSLPAAAVAYTAERDKTGKVTRVRPPDVTLIDEAVAGPPGACPQCWAVPSGRPLRESEDKKQRLHHCENCGTDYVVTT